MTHTDFTTAGTPNGRVGPAAITPIPVGLVFSYDGNTIAASINLWVVEVSTAGFLPYEASLLVQPTVEV
jgi:hypothetical protein